MAFSDIILILLLLILLALGGTYIYLNIAVGQVDFGEYEAQIRNELPNESSQFYHNMRFQEKEISYDFSDTCSSERREDFVEATRILEQNTLLSFYRSDDSQITVSCSDKIQEPTEEGHFIAGEGGPTAIINASKYAVILNGSIALYRPETCKTPQIATHELLHALGFNHNNNEESIMYPITKCYQAVDDYIINEINRLYAQRSLPDLIIEKASANKTGRYLNLNLIIANHGLQEVLESTLVITAEDVIVERYDTNNLGIGTRKTVTITNIRIPRKTSRITLTIETPQDELSSEGNTIELTALES